MAHTIGKQSSAHKKIKGSGVVSLAEPPLKVAAFNIQIFGIKKFSEKDVTEILLKIISRYDLILIQEVRDKSQTAIDRLIQNLNRLDPTDPFACVESERLGRTNSKEQYVFLYRPSRVTAVATYQFDDGLDDGTDVFQREPYAVRFSAPSAELPDFAIIAIHTDPDDAVKEVGALHNVYEATKTHWNLEDILIAGDFNADEGYVNQDDWSKITLRTDRRFKWLIDDQTDTTVGNTDRAYDRFVVVGKKLTQSIVPGSAVCYRFDEELKLSKEDAEDVSDHYPIELHLCGKVNRAVQKHISTDVSVVIKQKEELESVNAARKIYRADDPKECAGFESIVLKEDSAMYEVRATKHNVRNVIKTLKDFQATFPDIITDATVATATSYMASPIMTSAPVVYGLVLKKSATYEVTVTVTLQEPYLCHVTIAKHVS
ncbi:deoxyribonuclease-1-like [Littorina saxatilis]|uniref:Endonuclease/exonuclease/phosphatase domain-containing protein n=1 Tax=Littorina saxatilis TaxID=31220 RepID=A0AAN9AS79_9CAEN